MDQSELLSLLISLSSLVVVVAVLIGLFTAITKFIAQYGMFFVILAILYIILKDKLIYVNDLIDLVVAQLDRATAF